MTTHHSGRTLQELARELDGRVVGDPARTVTGVAPLEEAGPDQISFLANARYTEQARATRAGAVLAGPGVDLGDRALLVVPDPYLALAKLLELFHPTSRPAPGVDAAAIVGEGCVVDDTAHVGPGAVLGPRCRIAGGAVVMPGVVMGESVRVGRDSVLHPSVTIYDRCVVGERVIIHAGTVVGSDGFGFAREGERHRKIPQVGNVVVEDDVEIGANVTIDRATFGSTIIGRGTKIDNLVQIGHNVRIGDNCILVSQVGISGSTRIGKNVVFAGQSGAVGHIRIGDNAAIGAKSAVTRDVPAGAFVIGHPAIEAGVWKKATAVFSRLPDLYRRLRRLEAEGDDKEA